ncbi:MAG: hypothetical protein U0572_07750 [Phycisphaerales bacterium]
MHSFLGLCALCCSAVGATIARADLVTNIPPEHTYQLPWSDVAAIAGDETGFVAASGTAIEHPVAVVDGDPRTGPWQTTSIAAPNAGLLWGHGVARSNGRVAIGAPARSLRGNVVGSVSFFERSDGGVWTASGEFFGSATGELFGWSVALDGQWLAVAAPGAAVDGLGAAGLVRVYQHGRAGWTLVQTITSDEPRAGEFFGASLALHGDQLAIGGTGSDRAGPAGAGAAWLFERAPNAPFVLELVITNPNPHGGDALGASVDAREGIVAAGAPNADAATTDGGAVIVRTRGRGGAWMQETLAAPPGVSSAGLGTGVLVGNDRVIASEQIGTQLGCADFHRVNGAWSLVAKTGLRGAICQYGPRVAGALAGAGNTIGIVPIDLDCADPDFTTDCNGNYINDACEIAEGIASDLNGDGVIDGCPIARAAIDMPEPPDPSGDPVRMEAQFAARGTQIAVAPILRPVGWVGYATGACPQFVDFASAPLGIRQFIPVPCGYYGGGAGLTLGDGWLAASDVGDGAGRVSFVDVAPDGTFAPAGAVLGANEVSYFGWAVAASSSLVLATTPNDPQAGYPIRQIARDDGGAWLERLPLVVADPGPLTGIALVFDGEFVAISDSSDADGTWLQGRTRVGRRFADGSFVEEASLRAPLGMNGETSFGTYLALSGSRLFVSTSNWHGAIMRVSVYRRTNDASWRLEGEVEVPGAPSAANPARSIAARGTRIAIGTVDAGIATYFRAANGAWIASGTIPPTVAGWRFGSALAFADDATIATIAHRTPLWSNPSGEVWLIDPVTDCNGNGVDDSAEIAAGLVDANANGIPDECERPGDLNFDGTVDAVDLGLMLGRYGQGPGLGDLDDDGDVDAADLGLLLGDWG